jgi:putative oxidoreductase
MAAGQHSRTGRINMPNPMFSHADDIAATWTDFLLFASRVLLGWSFLAVGQAKLGDGPSTAAFFTKMGFFLPNILALLVGCAEFVLGAALILGIATRYAALALFVLTLVSIALTHRYWNYPVSEVPAQYHEFLKRVAVLTGPLYAFVVGAGRYSLDAMLAKR